MSLRTCSWLLPQNEQRYGTFAPLLPLVVLTRSPCPLASGLRLLLRLRLDLLGSFRFRRLGDAGALAAGEAGIVGSSDQRRSCEAVDRIDDAIVLCLIGRHEAVPLR